MRHVVVTAIMAWPVVGAAAGLARAEGIWFSYHEATGSGWANLFDGGPVETGEGATSGPDDSSMTFGAFDATQPGTMGAEVFAAGASRISPYEDDGMRMLVDLSTSYYPSLFPGGDNPGGAAEGEIYSVIEFVMPVEEVLWNYELRITDTIGFDGSSNIIFENVTQSETLVTLSEATPLVQTVLSGDEGDLMRLTVRMSGAGSTGPASTRQYRSELGMVFSVPEPWTGIALLVMVLIARLRRKERANGLLN